ncbi:MAG: imidazolonepropionase [Gammaproteobacteria bacterium]|nr:imidazolonepropionase [Gammaproteobacteria bacterium]
MNQRVLINATLATCSASNEPYGLIEHAAVATSDGLIEWCGPQSALPTQFRNHETLNCRGKLLTPSLIDCHTHIVHAGHRAGEFAMRLTGVSYEQIAASGGGIVSTVTATRNASVDDLVNATLPRIDALMSEGVAIIEIKSGYGLDTTTELNMLRAARQIATLRSVTIKTSYLGAHAVPVEYKDQADAYIDTVCIPTLELAAKENLVDAVDGFCESIAFTTTQIERVFRKANELSLPIKLHAEQLSLSGGAQLAAKFNALSADHLEYLDEAGARAMADAGTIAVLLPGAFYTLREKQLPPISLLRDYQIPIAIASDCNPGSSPMSSLLLTMNMACTLFRLTPEEALLGVTRQAARALGLTQQGEIKAGHVADFALWDCEDPAELSYRIGFNPLIQRICQNN